MKILQNNENIVEGGDDLLGELESSLYECEKPEVSLETGLDDFTKTGKERLAVHGPFKEGETSTENFCDEEVTSLEEEIARMRSETPEKEPTTMKKEMKVLKKFCSELSSIREENARLKKSNQELELRCMESEEKLQILGSDGDHSTSKEGKAKVLALKTIAAERDELQIHLRRLERKLNDRHDRPEHNEVFRSGSVLFNDVVENLRATRVEQSPALDEQLFQFKQKADRVDELERQLRLAVKDVESAEDDLHSMRTECAKAQIEALNQRTETETLKSKIACMEHEMEELKSMFKKQEALQIEKDRLQLSLDELVRMQDDHEHTRIQMKAVDVIQAEREHYKRKCEQLAGLESECSLLRTQLEHSKLIERERDSLRKQAEDLEKCIWEQKANVEGLMYHISCLVQDKEQQQVKAKEEVSSLKLELEEKKSQLAISEENIATLNLKIETSLCNLTNEAAQLRQDKGSLRKSLELITQEKLVIKHQCEELEKINCDLKWELQIKLKQIQDQEIQLGDKNRALETMQEVLNDRENFQNNQIAECNLLKQSKCAIESIAQALEQQYAEWDSTTEQFRCCPGCNDKKSTVKKELIIRNCASFTCKQKKPRLESKEVQCSFQPTCNCERTTQLYSQVAISRCIPTKQTSGGPHGLDLKLLNDLEEDVETNTMFAARPAEESKMRLVELKAELLRANETIISLRRQLTEAERTAAENIACRKHLNENLDDTNKVETGGSAAMLGTDNSKLKKDLENALETARKSANEASCAKVENSKLKQRLMQLEAKSAKLTTDMDLTRDFLRKTNNESRRLQDDNRRYEQKIRELEGEIAELRRQLDLVARPIEVADTNIMLLQEELSKLRKELYATRHKLRASKQENSQLCSGNVELGATLKAKAAAEIQANNLKSSAGTLKKQLAQMDEANKKPQMEKPALFEDMKGATTDLKANKVRRKKRKHGKQMEKHSDLKSLASVLAQEVMQERKKSLKLQKERDEIGELLRASLIKVESLERKAKTLSEEKEKMVKEMLKAVEEGDKVKRMDSEQQVKEAKGTSETLRSQLRAVDEELMEKRRSSFEDLKLKDGKLVLATFETVSSSPVFLTLSGSFSDKEMAFNGKKLRSSNLDHQLTKSSTKGLKALTVTELEFVHKHLNEATAKTIEYLRQKVGGCRPREDRDGLSFPCRIAKLEGDLLKKPRQAPQKISQMQNAIKLEEGRSRELKKDLNREEEGNPVTPAEVSRRISGDVEAMEKRMSRLLKRLHEEPMNAAKLKEKLERPARPRNELPAVRDTNVLKRNVYHAPSSKGSP